MIRVGVKGVIVHEGQVLLVKYKNRSGVHYNFPGGGIERGESIEAGLIREVREETGAKVLVKRLLLVGEYEPRQHNFEYGRIHKLSLYFLCELKPGKKIKKPKKPDSNQVGEEWFPIDALPDTLIPSYHDQVMASLNGRPPENPFTSQP